MTTVPEATAHAVRYEVSCLPIDHPEHPTFCLAVTYRGDGRWSVLSPSGRYYDADGASEQRYQWREPDLPSLTESMTGEQFAEDERRAEAWWAARTFDEKTALEVAKKCAPFVKAMGQTVADAIAYYDLAPEIGEPGDEPEWTI